MFIDIQNESPDCTDQKHRTFSVEKFENRKIESNRYFANEKSRFEVSKLKIRFKKYIVSII